MGRLNKKKTSILFVLISIVSFESNSQCFFSPNSLNSNSINLTFEHKDSTIQKKFEWTIKTLNMFTRLEALVGFYNDNDEPNAFALKKGVNSDRQEIYIGNKLLEKIYGENDLDNYIYPTIILGHEFGHLLQYNWSSKLYQEPKLTELQADFFAGFLSSMMSMHYNKNSSTKESKEKYLDLFANAVDLFHKLGDTNFGSKEHHGTPEERVHAFAFGFILWDNVMTLMAQKKLPKSFLEEDLKLYYNWSIKYIDWIKIEPEFGIGTQHDRIRKGLKEIPIKTDEQSLRQNYSLLDELVFIKI